MFVLFFIQWSTCKCFIECFTSSSNTIIATTVFLSQTADTKFPLRPLFYLKINKTWCLNIFFYSSKFGLNDFPLFLFRRIFYHIIYESKMPLVCNPIKRIEVKNKNVSTWIKMHKMSEYSVNWLFFKTCFIDNILSNSLSTGPNLWK